MMGKEALDGLSWQIGTNEKEEFHKGGLFMDLVFLD